MVDTRKNGRRFRRAPGRGHPAPARSAHHLQRASCQRPETRGLVRPRPSGRVKAAAHALGGTINDVMVAAITGALAPVHGRPGHPDRRAQLPRLYPRQSRAGEEERSSWATPSAWYFSPCLWASSNRQERFQVVHMRMTELKESPEAAVAIRLLNAAGMLPKEIENTAFRIYHAKATAVLTNVPGPQEQLYFAGSPLKIHDGLGAPGGQSRPGNQHPQLQRPNHGRHQHRRRPGARSAGNHLPL